MDAASSSAVSGIPGEEVHAEERLDRAVLEGGESERAPGEQVHAPHERDAAEDPAERLRGAHEVGERVHLVGEGAGERASQRDGAHEGEPVEAVDDHGLGQVEPLAPARQPEHRLEQREDEADARHQPGAVVATLPLRRGRRRDRREHDAGRQAERDASPRRRRASAPSRRGRSGVRSRAGCRGFGRAGSRRWSPWIGPYDEALRPGIGRRSRPRVRPRSDLRPVPGSTSPWSNANTMAAARSRSSSFVKMCPTCVFTVPSLMKSVEPISALLAPRRSASRTSRSRSVSSASRAADCVRGSAVVR